ncbi:hypothetical protein PTKIN_Ptkin14bG0028700 [Pterospermum kingtungense]
MSSINPNVLMNLSSSISSLSLYDCDLRGKFPKNIFHMPNLKMLNIRFNENLSIKLPKFNRSSHLKHLDLNGEHISGSILGEWGNLSKLKYLDLSRTYLSGRIPTSLGGLSNLYYLDLSYNNLSGQIPTSLGSLSNLYYLDLSRNSLSGQIPCSFVRNLTHLECLRIRDSTFFP